MDKTSDNSQTTGKTIDRSRKLTPEQQSELLEMLATGASVKEIALKFNVSIPIVYKYRTGAVGKGKDYKKILEERSIKTPDGCWVYASLTSDGRGSISFKGMTHTAPRAAYEVFKGPVPEGMFIVQTCKNKLCVNPEHLKLGTRSENRLISNVSRKLSEEVVRSIREKSAKGASLGMLADEFGLNASTVSRIVNRKIWSHVE